MKETIKLIVNHEIDGQEEGLLPRHPLFDAVPFNALTVFVTYALEQAITYPREDAGG
jgi:hypothetical protein